MDDAVMAPCSAAEGALLAELAATARCTCGDQDRSAVHEFPPCAVRLITQLHAEIVSLQALAEDALTAANAQPMDARRDGDPREDAEAVTGDSVVNRAGRRVASVPSQLHGRSATYRNRGCRCNPCTLADAQARRSSRAARLARRVLDRATGRLIAPVPANKHGRPGTYNDHGCRCQPCTRAATEQRLRRKRLRRASG